MKIKWLVFGIALMVTSLMQAAIYKVTNVSSGIKKIGFMESAKSYGAAFKRIKPNETVAIDKGNRKVGVLVIFDDLGAWYVENAALHARENAVVNIQVHDHGYCTIKRGKQITKVRGVLKSGYINPTLELEEEQGAQ